MVETLGYSLFNFIEDVLFSVAKMGFQLFNSTTGFRCLGAALLFWKNTSTGKNEREFFSKSVIPIVPHSWFHICMGLDTVSGLLRIVVNGIEVVNEEKEYFKNTTHWKPKSLKGAILQFMGYAGGFWYQHRSMFSYMNIFKSMMSTDDMVKRTSGGEECYIQGDYLRCCYSYCTPFVANNFILSAGMRWNGMWQVM